MSAAPGLSVIVVLVSIGSRAVRPLSVAPALTDTLPFGLCTVRRNCLSNVNGHPAAHVDDDGVDRRRRGAGGSGGLAGRWPKAQAGQEREGAGREGSRSVRVGSGLWDMGLSWGPLRRRWGGFLLLQPVGRGKVALHAGRYRATSRRVAGWAPVRRWVRRARALI